MFNLIFKNSRGQELDFTQIADSQILSVSGLETTTAEISEESNPVIDGVSFGTVRRGKRNVIITLAQYGINVKEIRRNIYNVLSGKEKGELRFIDESLDVSTSAYVENVVPTHWTNAPTLSISILCESAFFESTVTKKTRIISLEGKFSFPLELSEIGQEFGAILTENDLQIVNNGQEKTPCHIRLTFNGEVENPVITNFSTNEYFSLIRSFSSGQVVDIYSDVGQKRAILTDVDGTETDIFSDVSISSTWLFLKLGENILSVSSTLGLDKVLTEIEFKELYYGVD
ncbi:MAG: phage tail family protein [Clostridia bacterium]|nr:phage tail family protein [Clostridia bacterium]